MNLKYTPKSIAVIEKDAGLSILEMVQTFKAYGLMLFVREGLGFKGSNADDEAYEFISQYLADKTKNTMMLWTDIMTELFDEGFLAVEKAMILDLRNKAQGLIVNTDQTSSINNGSAESIQQ